MTLSKIYTDKRRLINKLAAYGTVPFVCISLVVLITFLHIVPGKAITGFRNFNLVFFFLGLFTGIPLTFVASGVVGIIKRSWKVFITNVFVTGVGFVSIMLVVGFIDGFLVFKCASSWKTYRNELSLKNVQLQPIGNDPRGIKSPSILSFELHSNLPHEILVDFYISIIGNDKSQILMSDTEEFENFEYTISPGRNEFTVKLEALDFWDKNMFDKNKNRSLRIEINSNYKNTGCYQEGGTELIEYQLPVEI